MSLFFSTTILIILSIVLPSVRTANILAVTTGYAGHIRPMISLLEELHLRGHNVTLLTDEMADSYADIYFLKYNGYKVIYVDHFGLSSRGNLRAWYERKQSDLFDVMWSDTDQGLVSNIMNTVKVLEKTFESLSSIEKNVASRLRQYLAVEPRPDAIVLDNSHFGVATYITANGYPCIINHVVAPVTGIDANRPSHESGFTEKEALRYPTRILALLQQFLFLVKAYPFLNSMVQFIDDPKISLANLNYLEKCLNVANIPLSFASLSADMLYNFYFVGLLASTKTLRYYESIDAYSNLETAFKAEKYSEELLYWLNYNRDKRLVLGVLGSTSSFPAQVISKLLDGLSTLLSRRNDVRVILSLRLKNKESYRYWLAQNETNKMLVESGVLFVSDGFVPYRELLALPNISAFITHCGINSVLEALTFGVPLLAMPGVGDQLGIAARIEEHELGQSLYTLSKGLGNFSPEDVVSKVEYLLDDAKYRANAQKMAEMIKLSGGSKRASDLIEQVIAAGSIDFLLPPTKIPGKLNMIYANSWDIKFITASPPSFCICDNSLHQNDPMIACDQCDRWFHLACIGEKRQLQELEQLEQFICPFCLEKSAQAQKSDRLVYNKRIKAAGTGKQEPKERRKRDTSSADRLATAATTAPQTSAQTSDRYYKFYNDESEADCAERSRKRRRTDAQTGETTAALTGATSSAVEATEDEEEPYTPPVTKIQTTRAVRSAGYTPSSVKNGLMSPSVTRYLPYEVERLDQYEFRLYDMIISKYYSYRYLFAASSSPTRMTTKSPQTSQDFSAAADAEMQEKLNSQRYRFILMLDYMNQCAIYENPTFRSFRDCEASDCEALHAKLLVEPAAYPGGKDKIIGYFTYWESLYGVPCLGYIFIAPSERRRGLAKLLIHHFAFRMYLFAPYLEFEYPAYGLCEVFRKMHMAVLIEMDIEMSTALAKTERKKHKYALQKLVENYKYVYAQRKQELSKDDIKKLEGSAVFFTRISNPKQQVEADQQQEASSSAKPQNMVVEHTKFYVPRANVVFLHHLPTV